MMKPSHVATIAILCVSLAACSGKGKQTANDDSAPAATLDGKTISVADVRAEQRGVPLPTNTAAANAMNQAAVQSIINRELMAKAADEAKIDQTPGFKRDAKWAVDGIKAAALAQQVMSKVQPPSAAAINKFIADNPRAFAERKFLIVDQLALMGPMLPPPPTAKTLEDFQAFMDKSGVAYQHRIDIVDSGAIDPGVLEGMLRVAPNSAFVVNNGREISVNQIHETRAAPLTGQGAIATAKRYLTNKAAEEAAKAYLDNLRSQAGSKIRYEPGYEPKAPAPTPAPVPAAAGPEAPKT